MTIIQCEANHCFKCVKTKNNPEGILLNATGSMSGV